MKISATIITLNEERNIARAIESLRCCDEILVVDSGSTDRTAGTGGATGRARGGDARGRAMPSRRILPPSRRRIDWILSLDADEALSEALEGEIWAIKKRARGSTATPCRGWRNTADAGSGIAAGIPTARCACTTAIAAPSGWAIMCMKACGCADRSGICASNILHFTCASLSEHLKTLDRYTTLAAQELVARRRLGIIRAPVLDPAWTFSGHYCCSAASSTDWKASASPGWQRFIRI